MAENVKYIKTMMDKGKESFIYDSFLLVYYR
jgi:hypothetical protein